MRILQVAQKNTFPPYDGGKLAMLSMADILSRAGHTVEQFFADTPTHPLSTIPTNYPYPVASCFLDTRVRAGKALMNLLFSKESYNIVRFRSTGLSAKLLEQINKGRYDLIQAESIFAMAMLEPIRNQIQVPVVCRAHNVEFLLWERRAEGDYHPLRRRYLQSLASRLRRDELRLLGQADAVIPVSQLDLDYLRKSGFTGRAFVSGIACKLKPAGEPRPGHDENSLFHLGAMNWGPNVEGIDWFISKVWPEVRNAFPTLELKLAGYDMPGRFSHLRNVGIQTHEVANATEFMEASGIMVVPLLSGSGIRVKIIEGLSLGKIILCTDRALEGIPAVDGEQLFVANTPADFVSALRKVKSQPGLAEAVSKNARIFAQLHYHPDTLSASLAQFYQTLYNA